MRLKAKHLIPAGLIASVAVFHFANTSLYNMPKNVISTLYTFDKVYISGFLSQEWGMFAPNPMDRDTNLLVNCLETLKKTSTGYMNISSSFNDLRMNNIFASADRVSRVPGNWAYLYLSPSRWEEDMKKQCSADDSTSACRSYRAVKDEREQSARKGLTLVASRYCRDISSPTSQFDKARIFIEIVDVPRWSERHVAQRPEPAMVEVGEVELIPVSGAKVWH